MISSRSTQHYSTTVEFSSCPDKSSTAELYQLAIEIIEQRFNSTCFVPSEAERKRGTMTNGVLYFIRVVHLVFRNIRRPNSVPRDACNATIWKSVHLSREPVKSSTEPEKG